MSKVCIIIISLLVVSCSSYKVNNKQRAEISDPIYFEKPSFDPKSVSRNNGVEYSTNPAKKKVDKEDFSLYVNDKEAKKLGQEVVKLAKEYLGCSYRAGGKNPKGFDCSGFTSYIYNKFGVSLAASSSGQAKDGVTIHDRKKLRAGDLVLFNGQTIGDRIGHVGIVTEVDKKTGEFYFIHSAFVGGVRIDHSSQEYYKKRYKTAKRIFN